MKGNNANDSASLQRLKQNLNWREGLPLRISLLKDQATVPGYANLCLKAAPQKAGETLPCQILELDDLEFPQGTVHNLLFPKVFETNGIQAVQILQQINSWMVEGGELLFDRPANCNESDWENFKKILESCGFGNIRTLNGAEAELRALKLRNLKTPPKRFVEERKAEVKQNLALEPSELLLFCAKPHQAQLNAEEILENLDKQAYQNWHLTFIGDLTLAKEHKRASTKNDLCAEELAHILEQSRSNSVALLQAGSTLKSEALQKMQAVLNADQDCQVVACLSYQRAEKGTKLIYLKDSFLSDSSTERQPQFLLIRKECFSECILAHLDDWYSWNWKKLAALLQDKKAKLVHEALHALGGIP